MFFNRGEFRPNARRTRTLLAHELAHTIVARDADPTVRRFASNRAVADGGDIIGADVSAKSPEVKALRRWLDRIDAERLDRWILRLQEKKSVALGKWRLNRAQRVLELGLLQAEDPLRDKLRMFIERMQARVGSSSVAPAAAAEEPRAAEPESVVAEETEEVASALGS